MVINNNLLGFLSQIIAPYQKQENIIDKEIQTYLAKYAIENESWGKS